jgi:hypothetical protein
LGLCKENKNITKQWVCETISIIKMLTISKNLVCPRDLESFKGGNFNTLSHTNHSIRATGATILGRNCSMAQTMAVTGHKSASSVAVTVLSLKTAFNLVKIHLLFRIMILIP